MDEHQSLPDINRLSIVVATILFLYALLPFISIPGFNWSFRFPWAVFYLRLDMNVIITILAALITASGTDWLLRSHPRLGDQNIVQHIILPTMTAWVIGIPLNRISMGLQWWAVFAFGGVLLIMVLVSEYIAVDITDTRHALAAMGLTAVSFSMFLFLAISVRGSGMRLYLVFPMLAVATFFMCLRTLYLRLAGKWCFSWSGGIMMAISQMVIGLHYLPLSPLGFSLILLGPAYALIGMAASVEEGRSWKKIWVEPLMMVLIVWGLVFAFRV